VELAPKLRPEDVDQAFRQLKAEMLRAAALAREVREDFHAFLRLPDERQADAYLTLGLVFLGFIAEKLEKLTEKDLLTSSQQLSAEVQELSQLADDFRDLEETFALSLSPAFSEEIKKARQEALGS